MYRLCGCSVTGENEILFFFLQTLKFFSIIFELVDYLDKYFKLTMLGMQSRKPRLTAVGIRCADHATPSIRKSH
jgi:hypothetical protein